MDNATKNLASGAQYARLGLTISNGVIAAIDGHLTIEEMQQILKNENFIRECATKIASEVLNIPIDQWFEQKTKIQRFYRSCFQLSVNWSKVLLPGKVEGVNFLEYVSEHLTEDDIFNAYAKKFGKDKVYTSYDNIRKSIKEQQIVPTGDYAFSHRGGIEPDVEHLNKSYNDFFQDGNDYMVIKEGLITTFRYRFETANTWGSKGLTRFHTLSEDSNDMFIYCNVNGQINVCRSSRDHKDADNGPRQVWRSTTA